VLGERENHYWYASNWKKDDLDDRFEPGSLGVPLFGGGQTVAVSAVQIAFYLGFDPIYLIGVDLDWKIPTTVQQSGEDVFKTGVLVHLESTEDDDYNHFDPRYFGKGKKWHAPDVRGIIRGFLNCRLAIEARGRRIYNATVGGKLDVVERVEFTSLFK